MPWDGHQLQNRDACALIAPHWPNQKVKGLATMRAESRLYVGARHIYENGAEDVGLFQHALSPSEVGTDFYHSIWTDSKDPAVYIPVAKENVKLAFKKWNDPWYRNGKLETRRWQPWVAYTSGWATFPEAWVWKHEADEHGKLTIPVGPWVETGRFLHEAIRGVANWHLLIEESLDKEGALREARRLAALFGISQGALAHSDRQAVHWQYPSKPTVPPADGHGPRPVKNDGR